MGFLIVIVVLLALLWLLMIRPQRRRQLEQRRMLGSIAAGDEVITAGGLIGKVRRVGDDEIELEIAPETTVRLAKRAVAAIVPPEQGLERAELEGAEEPEPSDPAEAKRR